MLRSGAADEPERSAQALRDDRAQRAGAGQLIEDILDVSRIITGKLRLERAAGRPAARSSRAALDAVRPAADAKGIELERRSPIAPARSFAATPTACSR